MGIKRVLILLLLLVTLPGFVMAQMVSIKASDGNVYQISAPKKFDVVDPSQFEILDKQGKAVTVSAKTAGELYSAHEALATFKVDVRPSSDKDIEAAVEVQNDSMVKEAVGQIGGIVMGALIPSLGPIAIVTDGIATVAGNQSEFNAQQTQILAAAAQFEMAEGFATLAGSQVDNMEKQIQGRKVVNIKEIQDAFKVRMLAQEMDVAAYNIVAPLLDPDYVTDDYAQNVISGGSTVMGIKEFFTPGVDVEKVRQEIANGIDKEAKILLAEQFSDSAYAINTKYLNDHGFFANQQSLVDQLNAEKDAEAARDLTKLKQQVKIEQAAAQRSARGGATMTGVNDGRNKLASIMQEKQSNVPKADFRKSDKDNADNIKDYWNEQITILKKKKRLYQSARTSALTKKGQAEKSRDSCRARGCDSKSLKFYEDQVLKHSKTVGYYHGLLGSTTKDGVDALIVWAEAQYEAAKQQYRIAKKQERVRKTAIARQQELDQILAEAEKLAAEEAEKKYDYRDYETGKNDGYVTIMPVVPSSGQQEHTIPQERLDDKQNDEIGSGTTFQPTSPGSQPQLVAGQFRVTPGRFRSEDFDLNAIVKATFGDNYRIADWNEFVAAYNADAEGLKNQMTEYHGNNLMVTRNGIHSAGTSNYGGGSFERQYYITYHNGTVPSYYAVYDHVGNHDYDLGSWIANSPILAVKIDSSQSDIDPSQWSGGPTVPTIWEGFGAYHHDTGVSPVAIAINLDPVNHEIQSVIKTATNQSLYIYDSYYQNKNSFGFTAFRQAPANSHDEGIEGLWAVTAPDADLHDYDYTTWGYWQQNVTNRNDKTADSPWVIGQLTPDNSIPTSGTATYIGNARGIVSDGVRDNSGVRGSVSLQANFSSRTLNGQISDMRFEDGSAWKTLNVSAAWAGGSNSIAGAITAPGTTGTVQGRFFGPQAEEMGGYWETTSGAELANGTFQAKK